MKYLEAKSNEALAIAKGKALETALEGEKEQLRQKTEALELNEINLTMSRIAQANAALRDSDPKLALSLLESCSPPTRCWEWYYARRLCRGAPLTLQAELASGTRFFSVAFSPDGRWIAATLDLPGLTVLDARTGAVKWRVAGESWDPGGWPPAFSPDSGRVAAWHSGLKEVKVWDVRTGKEVLTIPAGAGSFGGPLVFSPDGESLACAGFETATVVWNARTGEKRFAVPLRLIDQQVPGPLGSVVEKSHQTRLAYTPDGGTLAVHDGEAVRFLEPLTGKEQRKSIPARGSPSDFHPDGRRLALKTAAGAVRVLDLDTGVPLVDIPMPALGEEAAALRYSPGGKRLVCYGSIKGPPFWSPVHVFDADTGEVLNALPTRVWGGSPGSLSFSGDGQRLAVLATGTIHVWNVRELAGVLTLGGGVKVQGLYPMQMLDVAFRPDSGQLLTVARTWHPAAMAGRPAWEVTRWERDGGLAVATFAGHGSPIACAAFNPTSDRVAVGGWDKTVRVCDTETGRELFRVVLGASPTGLAFGPRDDFLAVLVEEEKVSRIVILDAVSGDRRRVIDPRKYLGAFAVSPDGGVVVAAVVDPATRALERIQSWSPRTGEEGWQGELPPNQFVNVTALAFSPDGRLLAGTTADRVVTLWDAGTGKERFRLKSQAQRVGALAFSADGRRLATGGQNGPAKVWDTRTGQEVYSFQGSDYGKYGLAFSADNMSLAISDGWTVSLLSAETVPSRVYLEGSSEEVAVLSPDGRLAASRGAENTILVFDAFTGQRLHRLTGLTRPIWSLAFSADGSRLLSLGRQELFADDPALRDRAPRKEEVRVWDVATGRQLARLDTGDKLVWGMALSADGARAAAFLFSSRDGVEISQEVHVWEVATGRRECAIVLESPVPGPGGDELAFAEDGKVVALRAGNVRLAWSVDGRRPVAVAGDPFANGERDRRAADGRRLWWSQALGEFFVQAEPDERQRERLLARARPDPAWDAAEAGRAEEKERWFTASFHLGRLLAKSPCDVDLLCRRARAYTALKWWEKARADCDDALLLRPRSVQAWMTRGVLDYKKGCLKEAHADLARAAAPR